MVQFCCAKCKLEFSLEDISNTYDYLSIVDLFQGFDFTCPNCKNDTFKISCPPCIIDYTESGFPPS